MSTVTLSKPHCAITSAEKPDGIASQAFTTALPEAQTFFTLFATFVSFHDVLFFVIARSEATKQSSLFRGSGLLRCARNDGTNQGRPALKCCLAYAHPARHSLSPPKCRPARAHRS